jgi:hypothetical protein
VLSCGTSCFTCGNSPQNGTETCDGQSCGFTCNSGFVLCGFACVSLASSDYNCGRCGFACSSSQSCAGGTCHDSCVSGTPKFAAPVALSNQPSYAVAAIAQFTGDAALDLAYLDGGTVYLAKGEGTDSFKAAQAVATVSGASGGEGSFATGDVNGDGVNDPVVNLGSAGITPLLSQPNGFTAGTSAFGGYVFGYSLGDLNGDGFADLVTFDDGRRGIGFAPGGRGGFGSMNLTRLDNSSFVDRTAYSLALCDVRGNGHLAVLLSDNYTGTFIGTGAGNEVTLLELNDAGTALSAPQVVYVNTKTTSAGLLAAADFTGDGRCDVVFDDQGTLVLLVGNGDGTFTKQSTPITTGSVYGLLPVAFSGGAKASSLLVQTTTQGTLFFLGGASGLTKVATLEAADAGTSIGGAGNLDGDLIPDVILNRAGQPPLLFKGQCQQ